MGSIKVIMINGQPIKKLIDALERGIEKAVKDANDGKYGDMVKEAVIYEKQKMDKYGQRLYEKYQQGFNEKHEYDLGIFNMLNNHHQMIKALIGEHEKTLDEIKDLMDEAKKLQRDYKKQRNNE